MSGHNHGEPWIVEEVEHHLCVTPQGRMDDLWFFEGVTRNKFAAFSDTDYAHAQRIVACVNACAGLDSLPDDVEVGALTRAVEALEMALEAWDHDGEPNAVGYEAAMRSARAALRVLGRR